MSKEEIYFKIDENLLKDYVEIINSTKETMKQIKNQLHEFSKAKNGQDKSNNSAKTIVDTNKLSSNSLKSISKMNEQLNSYIIKFPKERTEIFTDAIKQIMDTNNGMLSTRMIEPINIKRQYLRIMEDNNDIEKVSRGIYVFPNTFEDSYFSFQQKYKKAIFSHMNALYFYDMTEEFPYNYTVTVPQNYHVDNVNEMCNVFYVSDDIYEMGVTEVETPNGNKVRAYDKERCICDIIRSKGRMDSEQVKKTIKQYIKSQDKNIAKLSEYSKKMGINKKVMEIIGDADYE